MLRSRFPLGTTFRRISGTTIHFVSLHFSLSLYHSFSLYHSSSLCHSSSRLIVVSLAQNLAQCLAVSPVQLYFVSLTRSPCQSLSLTLAHSESFDLYDYQFSRGLCGVLDSEVVLELNCQLRGQKSEGQRSEVRSKV